MGKGQAKVQGPYKPDTTVDPLTQAERPAGLLDRAFWLSSETQGVFSSATLSGT